MTKESLLLDIRFSWMGLVIVSYFASRSLAKYSLSLLSVVGLMHLWPWVCELMPINTSTTLSVEAILIAGLGGLVLRDAAKRAFLKGEESESLLRVKVRVFNKLPFLASLIGLAFMQHLGRGSLLVFVGVCFFSLAFFLVRKPVFWYYLIFALGSCLSFFLWTTSNELNLLGANITWSLGLGLLFKTFGDLNEN